MVKSTTNHAIGIGNAWNIFLLGLFARLFVAKRWIDVSNLERSFVDNNLFFLNERRLQCSKVGVALWMFSNSCQKQSWVTLVPLWRKTVCKIYTLYEFDCQTKTRNHGFKSNSITKFTSHCKTIGSNILGLLVYIILI